MSQKNLGKEMIRKYLLLMRHGDVNRGHPDNAIEQNLSYEGWELSRLHAKILVQVIKNMSNDKIIVSEIWSSEYNHSIGSAEEIRVALNKDKETLFKKHFLNPSLDQKAKSNECFKEIQNFFSSPSNQSLLIVGHMPQLSWLLEKTTKTSAALERSEILCIEVTGKRATNLAYQLLWSISKSDKETFERVREKIKYKMDTAKLLGSIMTVGLGWILIYFLDADKYCKLNILQRFFLGASAMLFFASIAAYIATMYHYIMILS